MNGERMAARGEREISRHSVGAALTAALVLLAACSIAIPPNEYGLRVVPDLATYERLAAHDPDKRLVDVTTADPTIRLDVRYATANNILHRPLYPVVRVMLRAPAAQALADVQRELAKEGLGLKVFDGYRPYRVTKQLWEPLKNPDYVADRRKARATIAGRRSISRSSISRRARSCRCRPASTTCHRAQRSRLPTFPRTSSPTAQNCSRR